MEVIIRQIHTLSTANESDLKTLKNFLCHDRDTLEVLKANAHQIGPALQMLDMAQHSLGIAFLLEVQLSAGPDAYDQSATFSYVGKFLKFADKNQFRKASSAIISVCEIYGQMGVDKGRSYMFQTLIPLRCALEKLRPTPETLTPVHSEFLRICLKTKAYHLAVSVIEQPIFDISFSNNNNSQSFLCYFYYAALIQIGMKEYTAALKLLLVVITCPATVLSIIQIDAFKKYALLSLKVFGEVQPLPVYVSQIVQRYTKSPSYVLSIAESYKEGDLAAMQSVVDEKLALIQDDNNMGIVQQVITSLRRRKVQTLTKTYLTLSLSEIARELGLEETNLQAVEELLFDMISCGNINARIDQITGNVSFEDDQNETDMGPAMGERLQTMMSHILELAQRLRVFEQQVISCDAYVRKTAALEPSGLGTISGYDFMDM